MEATCDSTSVHTEETSVPLSSHQSYQTFRRSSCAAEFHAAEKMYLALDERDELQRVKLLSNCRRQAWFVRNVTNGKVHVASNACRLRWCPICSRAKSMYITHSVAPWIASYQTSRFLTLTLKHSNAPLRAQIDKLYADFRTLRKNTQFKGLCSGGVWFFQIKFIEETQSWHPHLHCILSGKYIPHEWLSQLWYKTTHSSTIVDIRIVRDPEKAANEVARYSATPAQLEKLDDSHQVEVFDAMHRRRMCGSWGEAKGVSLSPPKSVDKSKYEDLGSYFVVIGLADTDDNARQIYTAWVSDSSLKPGIKMTGADAWLDGRIEDLKADVEKYRADPFLDYG